MSARTWGVSVSGTPARGARNGQPAFRPYTYNGTGEDTLTPWMDHGCYCAGNKRAYQAHLSIGEEPCGRSRAAHKASLLAAIRHAEGRKP